MAKTAEELRALIVAYMGGERGATFYTPEEWKTRGEEYCNRNAALVVAYNGGDAGQYFNYDYCRYAALEGLNKALNAVGYFFEDATGRYGGVYALGL